MIFILAHTVTYALALYTGLFLVITHLFVLLYEEPALTQTFGDAYQQYRTAVHRKLPRFG